MRTATKLTAYGAALVLVTAGAWTAGAAVGDPRPAAEVPTTAHTGEPHPPEEGPR